MSLSDDLEARGGFGVGCLVDDEGRDAVFGIERQVVGRFLDSAGERMRWVEKGMERSRRSQWMASEAVKGV